MVEVDTKTLETIKEEIKNNNIAILSNEFVVIPLKEYERGKKLDELYLQFLEDKAQGKVYKSSAKELIEKIENEL
jgi:PHD/YefM family antitoxin component YafN of YafNO toxin-antitoxin module